MRRTDVFYYSLAQADQLLDQSMKLSEDCLCLWVIKNQTTRGLSSGIYQIMNTMEFCIGVVIINQHLSL